MLKKIKTILTRTEKIEMIFLFIGSVILSFSEIFSIGVLIPLMGLLLNPKMIESSGFLKKLYLLSGARDIPSFFTLLASSAIVIFLLKGVYSVFLLYKQQRFAGRIYNRLTVGVLNYYINKDYAYHLVSNSSVLFKNICSEVSLFTACIIMPMIVIGSEAIILTGFFLFMFFLYPAATLILVSIAGAVVLGINLFLKKRVKQYAVERNLYSGSYYKYALETLNAVKEIKMFSVQNYFSERFRETVGKYYNSFVKSNIASSLPRYFFETTLFCTVLVVMIVSVHTNKNHASIVPMMSVICLVALRLMPSITKITTNINAFHYSFNSLDMVYHIVLDYDKELPSSTDARGFFDSKKDGALQLRDVCFKYSTATKPIFDQLNLNIPLGSTVAFIGETGSGKSTLLDILMGLLIPTSGAVFYADTALTAGNISLYRKCIGYVPQNIFLMDDTIAANIAFGIAVKDIDPVKLQQAIRVSQLETFVKGLPSGVKTLVGEKGVRISGGQKQRIGIARALYNDPDILVFDEATSALDVKTEADLYAAVNKGLNKTVIFVTHRFSAIETADLIFILDSGRIIKHGKLAELKPDIENFRNILKNEESITAES